VANSKNSKQTQKSNKTNTKKKNTHAKARVNERAAKHPVKNFWVAVGFILLPLVVGLAASAITGNAQQAFGTLKQPPLAPPAWLFPVAWTILYLLMGVASYLIYRVKPTDKAGRDLRTAELTLFYVQLAFNFAWTILFFNLEIRYFAFGWLMVMWLMILALIIMAFKNRKGAAWCLMPYILWCTFAAYLNISIAILN
jgi:tryptophan-rich sensory protein